MVLLDGKKLADLRLQKLTQEVSSLTGRKPKLVVIRVGNDPASEVYVKKKIKNAAQVGVISEERHLDEKISLPELLKIVSAYNADPETDGILVQLPLPKHIPTQVVIESVSPEKDVDGFHPMNLGRLAVGEPCLTACTPRGIMNLLEHYKVPLKGKRAVVVGRSRIVGRPISLLLDQAGCTVTVVHRDTPDSSKYNAEADLLVVAAGVRGLVTEKDVKPGATVIDVGIHRLDSGKLVGDVEFDRVKDKVSAITPVPGGVGPLTVCTLLENTLQAFRSKK